MKGPNDIEGCDYVHEGPDECDHVYVEAGRSWNGVLLCACARKYWVGLHAHWHENGWCHNPTECFKSTEVPMKAMPTTRPALALAQRAAKVGCSFGLPRAQVFQRWNGSYDKLELYVAFDTPDQRNPYPGVKIATWTELRPYAPSDDCFMVLLDCERFDEVTSEWLTKELLAQSLKVERTEARVYPSAYPGDDDFMPYPYPGDDDFMPYPYTRMQDKNTQPTPSLAPTAPATSAPPVAEGDSIVEVSQDALARMRLAVLDTIEFAYTVRETAQRQVIGELVLELINAVDELVTSARE